MENPWHNLPSAPPYLQASDRDIVLRFNSTVDTVHQIRHEVMPEPYLGRPDAEIVLLNLNPGFDEQDQSLYEQEYGRVVWRKNTFHEQLDYPFYLLDPELKKWPGPKWWRRKLRQVIELAGEKTVANKMCCIEYFPYHSLKFKEMDEIVESQRYSFNLARQAIERNAIIIVMRGAKLWRKAIPGLDTYANYFRLNSFQNVAITRGNCPLGFPAIEQALRMGVSTQQPS